MMGLWGHFFFPYFPNFLWYFKCQSIFRKKKMKDLLTLSQNLFSTTNSKPSFTWLPCPQSLSCRYGRLSYTLQPDPDTGPLPKEATYKEFPRLFLTWIWCRLFWVWEMRPGKAHECSFNFPDYAPKFTGFVSVPLSLSSTHEAEVSLPHLVGPCWSPAPILWEPSPVPVYWFASPAVTKHYRLSDLNHRNPLSHSSGGQRSKIKVSAGLVLPEGREGELWSRPLSLAPNVHLFVLSFTLPSLYMFLCVQIPLSLKRHRRVKLSN